MTKKNKIAIELDADTKKGTVKVKKFGDDVAGAFDKIKRKAKGVTNALKATKFQMAAVAIAATASVAVITKLAKAAGEIGDKFNKMSLRTGETVENLVALEYAAEISGTSIDVVERALKNASKTMYSYSKGTGAARDSLDSMGVSVMGSTGQLKGVIPFLLDVAEKIKFMKDETKKAAIAAEIFGGKAGPALLPMLKEGSDGIQALMDKAHDLGIVFSTEDAAAAANFQDRIKDLTDTMTGFTRVVGFDLLPLLTNYLQLTTNWIQKNRKIIGQKLPEYIGKMKIALFGLWGMLKRGIKIGGKIKETFKVGLLAIFAGLKAFLQIGQVVEKSFKAIYFTGQLAFAGLVDAIRILVNFMRDNLFKAFDKLFDGLVKLGAIKDNPFDTLTESIGNFSAASHAAAIQTFDSIEGTEDKYKSVIAIVDGWAASVYNVEVAEKSLEKQVKKTVKVAKKIKPVIIGNGNLAGNLIDLSNQGGPTSSIADHEKALEFAKFLGESTSDALREGIINGTDAAMDVVSDVISNVLGQTVSKTMSESIQKSISGTAGVFAGSMVGGVVGSIAGSAVGSFFDSGPSASDLRITELNKQTKELIRNTAAIQRETDARGREYSTYSSAIHSLSEGLITAAESIHPLILGSAIAKNRGGGGLADETIKQLELKNQSLEALMMEVKSTNFGNIGDSITAEINKTDAEIDNLTASLSGFRVAIDSFQEGIAQSGKDMLQTAGDVFRSESEIQKRDFQDSAKNLLVGLAETFELEELLSSDQVSAVKDFTSASGMALHMLTMLTDEQDAYNQVLSLTHDLVETAVLQEKALAKNLQDQVASWQTGLTRRDWGMADWKLEFNRIGSEINTLNTDSESYFGTAISLAEEQFQALQTIVSISEQQLSALENTQDSLKDQIWDIKSGGAADTTSAGAWFERFDELYGAAVSGDDSKAISVFQQFLPEFKDVMLSTGYTAEEYSTLTTTALGEILNNVNSNITGLNDTINNAGTYAPAVDEGVVQTQNFNIELKLNEEVLSGWLIEQFNSNGEVVTAVRKVAA